MMKHSLIFLFALFISDTLAQSFIVTPEGLRNSSDPEINYLVLEFKGKTANEIYGSAVQFINENFNNPNEVVKAKNDGVYLKFSTHVNPIFTINNSGIDVLAEAYFTIELKFKEGKIRFEVVDLKMISENNYPVYFQGSRWGGFPIYKKDGELYQPEAKKTLEQYINRFISNLNEFILKGGQDDDW